MELTSSQQLALPQARVWAALNDPEILKACIPGCDSVVKLSDSQYEVSITASVGPVKAKFRGKMELVDVNAPNGYTIKFDGQGGAAGFGKGEARVALTPEGSGTRLDYTATAQIGGKLAQVGSRLVDGVARKMADEFFTRFASTVDAGAPAPEEPAAAAAAETSVVTTSTGAKPGLPGWVWIAALLVVVALIVLLRR